MELFCDIVGQNRAISLLRSVLQGGEPAHAYLFTGPPGVGKTRAAFEFASGLLGLGQAGIETLHSGLQPDFTLARRDKTRLSIEEVRRIEEWLSHCPYRSSRRVVLVPEAHLLSLDAANAMLKTLEEPPEYAVFVLVSDEREILPTIASRCQEVRFSPLPAPLIQAALVGDNIDEGRARLAAELARGSLGRARALAGRPELECAVQDIQAFLTDVLNRKELAVLEKAEELEKDEIGRLLFFSALEVAIRDLEVYLGSGRKELLVFPENADLADKFRGRQLRLRKALAEIAVLEERFHTNVNPLLINLNLLFGVRQAVKEA